MVPDGTEAFKNAPPRPKLTAAVERLIRVVGRGRAHIAVVSLVSKPKRLLIVKVHGMGDSVLIRLIIEQLRKHQPEMQIGVLAGPETREILTLGTDFRVHLYNPKTLSTGSVFSTLREIRRSGYDAVLNFEQGSIAGTAFIGCAGIPFHMGFLPVGNNPKSLFLTHGVRFAESRSMWQSFVALARMVDSGVTEEAGELTIGSGPENENWVSEWCRANIGDNGENLVAFHLGCGRGMDYRRWPMEKFFALAERITGDSERVTILLTGTALERPLISEFMTAYPGRAVDASSLGNIERTAALLRRSKLLVSVDTGVMHLAAALGVPTVGLFGPNTPTHWAPIGSRATFVYETRVVCSPCINNFQNLLPSDCINIDRSRCMRDISIESVLAAVRRVARGTFQTTEVGSKTRQLAKVNSAL